jgi:prepilin-type processing-associated H-X9-DG protein
MTRRLFVPLALLGVCLVVLPACRKKKPAEDDGGGGAAGPVAPGAPPAVSTDYFVFARLNAKHITGSPLFADTKTAVAKNGGTADWDKMEDQMSRELGVKPTDVDTVTAVVTDPPGKGPPNFVVIVESSKPFNKTGVFGMKSGAKPDGRGFYRADGGLVHFPTDKIAVLVSEPLVAKYLDGYAKDRSGWPLTADLTRAAGDHTAFAVVNMQKLPREELGPQEVREFGALISAQKVTVTADLKGKEVSVGARASFADPGTAAQARDKVLDFVKQAGKAVDEFATGRELADFAMVRPAVTEAQRTLKNVSVGVSGSDVTLSGSYRAEFDVGQMVAEAVKKVQAAAGRVTAQNNLKQIGLALHNYESATGQFPIHATGMNGMPLRNPADKPLLSWRVAILSYIEQRDLYEQFRLNEPWDSAYNKTLIAKMPKIYAPVEKPGKPGMTHLQMIVGPGGVSPFGGRVTDFTDGLSNTIAVIETADAVEWTKPADVTVPAKFAPGELRKKFGGQFAGGFNVCMWDGSVRFVRETVSENTLKLLFDPRDGMALPTDW